MHKAICDQAAADAMALAMRGDNQNALKVIHAAVERVITDPRTIASQIGHYGLDVACFKIGDQVFADSDLSIPISAEEPTYVYIATRLQKAGGHTRVLLDFINARPGGNHVILITGREGPSDTAWFHQRLHSISNYRLLIAPHGKEILKVRWLQTKLVEFGPTHTYLFNHHEDSVAVAALSPSLKLAASFCHHGDHHLCLGVFASHLIHLDLSPMSYHQCRTCNITNYYVPMTTEDHGKRSGPFLSDQRLRTATAAGMNKLALPYPYSYFKTIPKLLAETGGTHLHIGKLSRIARWIIKRNLRKQGVPSSRFRQLKWTASIWKTLVEEHIDLYVGSFPLGGGLTMVEAMGAAVPIVAHRHLFHRALSGFDMLYPCAFSWREPMALIEYCGTLDAVELQKQSIAARACYERYHRPTLLAQKLNLTDILEVPALAPFEKDVARWQKAIAQQQSTIPTFLRFARRFYRLLRRISTRFSTET